MSNLRGWMHHNGIDPEKALCLCIGTDGLSIEKHNMMSISYASTKEKPTTIYISGADVGKVFDYVGLPASHYAQHAVGFPRAEEMIRPLILEADFIVMHTAERFTLPWIKANYPDLYNIMDECLDIVNMVKLVESAEYIPFQTATIKDLHRRLEDGLFGIKGGYSLKAILERYLVDPTVAGIPLECQVANLQKLYEILLDIDT